MCGIAGIVGSRPIPSRWLDAMLSVQRHRGPDGGGQWQGLISSDRELLLGHRRLSILDLSDAGAQPMADATGRFVITYNGEIYNYIEIRQELHGLGVSFRSHSDTEVVVEAYKQWGASCLDRFNGMFAFALYDSVRGVLFCARDRYGEKPFLFSFGKGFFAFASEYKALLQHPGIPLEVDEWRLLRAAHNASTGLDADRQTVFKTVEQLLPGEAMEVDVKTLRHRIWRYWQIQAGPLREDANEQEVFAEFQELLTDSVRLRLRSDVPVGSCLSGGLDSSSIVCVTHQLLRAQGAACGQKTFSACSEIELYDERRFIRQVVAGTNIEPHYIFPAVDDLMNELDKVIWHQDEPFAGTSIYAQWCVFGCAAKERIKVMLDGQGADESLCGYYEFRRPFLCGLLGKGCWSLTWREALSANNNERRALQAFWRAFADAVTPSRLQSAFRGFRRNRRPPIWLNPEALAASFPGRLAGRFQQRRSAQELSLRSEE